ncbi:MAG: TPM domain-containing protein [Phycisphaerae bacterium]|nr:TPM domain-containing protein [Phycisphaerae bacterium]
MHNSAVWFFVMILLTPVVAVGNYAPSQLPTAKHYVEDHANVVRPEHEQALNRLLQELEQKTGAQYIVLTVSTTAGVPIDQYSLEVARDTWKLGQQDKDNGMLFVIAVSDRKYWFTPGKGLEGFLTDSYLAGLGERTLVPYLKQGQYSEGIHAVNLAVARRIASQTGATLSGLPAPSQGLIDLRTTQQPNRSAPPRRVDGRSPNPQPFRPTPVQHVGGGSLNWLPALPCCLGLFVALPILLLIRAGRGAGGYSETSGAFFPTMFNGFSSHTRHHHLGPYGHGLRGPLRGGPFGGGFGGFGGGIGRRPGGHAGGGIGHFGGGRGGHFSGRGAGGSW